LIDTLPSDALQHALAAWLDPTRAATSQRFPDLLEARYEADTGRARSRAGGVTMLAGTAVMLLLWLLLGSAPAGGSALSQNLFIDAVIPFCGIMGLVLLTDPPPAQREAALFAPLLAIALSMCLMLHNSAKAGAEMSTGSTMLLLIFTGSVLQLRFWHMLGFTLLLCAGFAAGITLATGLPIAYRWNLCVLNVVAGFFILLVNWRLHADHRRNYALSLREQLRLADLSQRNAMLDALVRSDALTGLANRRAYDAWLQNTWLQARAPALPVGLIILDIDHFKAYNDFYGHAAGDICLQTISRCLREQLRGTTDLVARLGGEEFAVLLPGLQTATSGDIAERLRHAVATLELPHLGAGGSVSISCGAASLPARDPYTPADLFAAADAALYHAKQSGRNRVCIADPPAPRAAPAAGAAVHQDGIERAAPGTG